MKAHANTSAWSGSRNQDEMESMHPRIASAFKLGIQVLLNRGVIVRNGKPGEASASFQDHHVQPVAQWGHLFLSGIFYAP